MTSIEKIGKFEVYALFITIISNNIIINIPTIILNLTSTGSWLNIIYLTLICLFFILTVCKFFKPFVNFDILDISDFLGGKILKTLMGILYIILFLTFSALCLRYFSYSLKMIYFDNISIVLLMLLFLIPAVIAAKTGLKAISGTTIVFLPFSILSLIVFSVAASNNFSWENLFPVLRIWSERNFFNKHT